MLYKGRINLKAALFRNRGDITVVDKDIPALEDNQVLLKIDYAGICGTDKEIFNGDIPSKPVVLGHEFSGEAIEIGSKVKNIEIGHYYNVQPNLSCGICEVCRKERYSLCKNKISYGIHIDGGFAEYCAVNYNQLFPVFNITHIESALVEPIACCLHGLNRCDLSVGQDVLIIGGGFIGLIFVQLAKMRGTNVHLIEPDNNKRALAKSLGADSVYESISEINMDFDVVIEAVGKTETVKNAFQVVGRGGDILLFGVCPEGESISLKPYKVWEKELKIIGSRSTEHNHFYAIRILPKLNIKDLISHVIALDNIERGFEMMIKEDCIKVVVHIPGSD
jgi:2-desacetyl-2-hydroxyethyl bacteriochlorophyllide A dehydrogenase